MGPSIASMLADEELARRAAAGPPRPPRHEGLSPVRRLRRGHLLGPARSARKAIGYAVARAGLRMAGDRRPLRPAAPPGAFRIPG